MASTERQAKAETWAGKDRLLSVGDGLCLNVRRSSKTWVTRRRIGGQMRVHTLGRYPDMPVTGRILVDLMAGAPLADITLEHAKVIGPIRDVNL